MILDKATYEVALSFESRSGPYKTTDWCVKLKYPVEFNRMRYLISCSLCVVSIQRFLSVYIEDVLERPAVEMEKVLSFVGVKFKRPDMLKALPVFVEALQQADRKSVV